MLAEHLCQLLLIHILSKVLDVDIGELCAWTKALSLALLERFEAAHKYFSVIKQHTVQSLYRFLGSLRGLKLNKTIAIWAIVTTYNLARQDFAEAREGVV